MLNVFRKVKLLEEVVVEKKGDSLLKLIGLFVFLICLAGTLFAQDDCASFENTTDAGNESWIGHVYKYPNDARPNVDDLSIGGVYKGRLQTTGDWTGGINFDYSFDDPTGNDASTITTTSGCVITLEDFAVLFRGIYTIPATGEYVITINHDDGARLMINGTTVHSRWNTFKHLPENERSYYFTHTVGTVLDLELAFYERNTTNRLSFSIERYYGPGVISRQQSTLCAVAPDPMPFLSVSPASFESQLPPVYQWQYSDTPSIQSSWQNIPGATETTYKIPRYDESDPLAFTGERHFRRMAYPSGVPTAAEYTNVVSITLSLAAQGVTNLETYLDTYGDMQWYGYVYDKARNFEDQDFMGRLVYPKDTEFLRAEFLEEFGGRTGMFTGSTSPSSSSVLGATYDGCDFPRDRFSVQYRMRIAVTPGSYFYTVAGDDGFRMMINDQPDMSGNFYGTNGNSDFAVDRWTNGNKPDTGISSEIVLTTETTLYFVIEYFEEAGGNLIGFSNVRDFFQALPVEWGKISGNPCGGNNCLVWETLQEKYTSHFIVERSADGREWVPAGDHVPAQGVSTETTIYRFTDKSVTKERMFYRIKQVDLDGKKDYSITIRIDNPSFQKKMLPYPNPTVDRVRFYSEDEVLLVQVSSFGGNVNYRAAFDSVGQHLYELDLSTQQIGQYVITLVTKASRTSYKIVKR